MNHQQGYQARSYRFFGIILGALNWQSYFRFCSMTSCMGIRVHNGKSVEFLRWQWYTDTTRQNATPVGNIHSLSHLPLRAMHLLNFLQFMGFKENPVN